MNDLMKQNYSEADKYTHFESSQTNPLATNSIGVHKNNICKKEVAPSSKLQTERQTAIKLFMQIGKGCLGQQQFKMQQSDRCKKKDNVISFTKNNLMNFFKIDFINTPTRYCSTKSEPQIYKHFYKYLYQEMRYLEINDVHKMKSVKMRTTIVRRVLDKYVSDHFHLSEAQVQHIDKYNKRLTKVDKAKYEQLNIPEPPSRMNSQFHQIIFSISGIRQYYREYITQNKFQSYLFRVQGQQIEEYHERVTAILNNYTQDNNSENILQGMNKIRALSRRPLFYKEIEQYSKEAKRILSQYCH